MNRGRAMAQVARELSQELALIPPFPPEEFVPRFARRRGITITLIPFPMVRNATGYVLRLSESHYLIFYDPDLPKARSIYHECGHIHFDHVPICTDEEREALLSMVSSALQVPTMFRRTNRFSLPMELDAEGFALALTTYSCAISPTFVTEQDASEPESDEALAAINRFYDDIGF